MEKQINGKVYELVIDEVEYSCMRCAFYNDDDGCLEAGNDCVSACDGPQYWKLKE